MDVSGEVVNINTKYIMDVVMKTRIFAIAFLLISLPLAAFSSHLTEYSGSAKLYIVKFYTDPVCIYDTPDSETYKNLQQEHLPNPGKEDVFIEAVDRSTNMVMFVHQGRKMWVHKSEVKIKARSKP